MKPTIYETAQGGNRLETLIALRDRLASELDNPNLPSREVAPITRQLTAVLLEIEQLAEPEKENPVDQAKESYTRRRAASLGTSTDV